MLLSKFNYHTQIYLLLNMNGINMSTVTNYMLGSTQVRNIYYGSNLIWPLTQIDDYFYIETAHNSIGVDDYIYVPVLCSRMEADTSSNIHYPQTLYYSYDQINWNVADPPVPGPHDFDYITYSWQDQSTGGYSYSYERAYYKILATSHDKIYLRGNLSPWVHGDNSYAPQQYKDFTRPIIINLHSEYYDDQNRQIVINNISVGGNICSLLYGDTTHYEIPNDYTYVFESFFGGTDSSVGHYLQDVSNLILPNNVTAYCYYLTFSGSQITTSPLLPALTLAQGCYEMMFYGCSNLSNIKCLATDISATDCTYNWVSYVPRTGTFTKAASMNSWTTGASGIPAGWKIQNYSPTPHDYSQDYLTFEALESGTFTWTDTGNNNSISYSIDDGSTWTTLSSGSSTPTIATNSKVLFKASGLTVSSSYGIGTFSSSGRFNVMGNVMSLVDGDNFASSTTLSNDYQLTRLFRQCTNLVDASDLILPAITLASSCYNNMFSKCTSLTTAPELPATTLSVNCYMYMFFNCSSLTTAPELPATTLVSSCYHGMFSGCSSLNYIKCLATDIPTEGTTNWVKGVSNNGTFVRAASATNWPRSNSGIPSGWTVVDAS